MKLNKKLISLFAALVVLVGLAACGNDNDDDSIEGSDTDGVEIADIDNEVEANDDEADAVSGPSESSDPADLVEVMTNGANWMFAATADMELTEDLVIQGELEKSNGEIGRKLALYAQIRENNVSTVTDEFMLTVPNVIVRSENTLIQHGTVNGNVIVEAEGFELNGTNITGDLVFSSQELLDSAEISDEDLVAGEITIAAE